MTIKWKFNSIWISS